MLGNSQITTIKKTEKSTLGSVRFGWSKEKFPQTKRVNWKINSLESLVWKGDCLLNNKFECKMFLLLKKQSQFNKLQIKFDK